MRARIACLVPALALAACGSPPSVTVHSSTQVGTVAQPPLITGRDGGWGARVFGREVFVYGDTAVTVADATGSTFHSNSFSFTDDTTASDDITGLGERLDAAGSPAMLVPNTDDEAAFIAAHRDTGGGHCMTQPCGARWAVWPGATVWDADRARAIVSYGLVYAEPGAFNFHGVGQSLAVWSAFDQPATRPVANRCADHPTLMFCQGERAWGAALVVDGDTLYAFGCDGGNHCALARVALASATDRSQWQAWNGDAWASLDGAANLFDGAPILRVFFDRRANAWVAVYSKPLSDDVQVRTAPAITGPWSDDATLFHADHHASDGGWTYDAIVQPDYEEDLGRVEYVTYSRPTGTFFGSEFVLERVQFQ